MKVLGIIAEYNPFHKGHEYHIQKAKEITGADFTIVIMGGDFMQRGEPAVIEKFLRAETALMGGADLVLELPTAYAAGSAEDFAGGAVSLLEETGVVDCLCFGSEEGDLTPLYEYARLFKEEPPLFKELLKDLLRQGVSYPAARSRAALEYKNCTDRIMPCCADDADCKGMALPALENPNDILGVEYIRALLRNGSSIKPYTIKRQGSPYGNILIDENMPSAAAVRHALTTDSDTDLSNALPKYSEKIIKKEISAGNLMGIDDFSQILSWHLLTLSAEELSSFQDIGNDLARRINHLRFEFTCVSAFADLLKTKQITHTRATRALMHILLGLKQTDIEACRKENYPVYLHALGFKESARPLLKAIKQNSASPLITKAADAPRLLSSQRLELFNKTVYASDLYGMILSQKSQNMFTEVLRIPPVILTDDKVFN